jgi:protein TonB
MLPKKNPKKDLSKNSSLYFAIGLAVVLFISWQAIEWKTYSKTTYTYDSLKIENDSSDDIPLIREIKTPPPPPPKIPTEIKVLDDQDDEIETEISTTEIETDEIIDVKDIKVIDILDNDPVPFEIIEDVPIYPGCEAVAKEDRRKCFQQKIFKHIKDNFRYPSIAQDLGISGKVYMQFVIDKDGSIADIKIARSPDDNLGKEAKRIISKLPKMTPGKQRGRAVRVPFSIPITFRLQ